ncbi:MAG TPA: bifunctional diguanylate cyclase/phosphodiesterase [Micromonosporaceae bacterium]|nr:bifunctional diguanylate cyclase/phosphodiesterase [Micromonosporaceae bacterium]
MTPSAGSAVAAVLCFSVAALVMFRLVRAAWRPGHAVGRGHVLLAGGVVVTTLTALVVAIVVQLSPTTAETAAGRLVLATIAAIGTGAGGCALLGGVLHLPGVAQSRRGRFRQLLDGSQLATGTSFLVWTLTVTSGRLEGQMAKTATTPWFSVPLSVMALLVGVLVVVGVRSARPRAGLLLVFGGVGVVSLGGAGLALCLAMGYAAGLVASGAAIAAGGVLVAFTTPLTDRVGEPDEAKYRSSIVHSVGCIAGFILGSMQLFMITDGSLDPGATGIGLAAGLALVGRQRMAIQDERRAARFFAEQENKYRKMAHTDALTQLANRRGLMQVLTEQVVGGGPSCVLAALDLDGFKNINDMRGHDIGDRVLVEVGRRLSANLRRGDVPARLGGDEFAVLMWARPDEAEQVAQRLLTALSEPYAPDAGTVFLTASIGLAGCGTAHDIPTLLRNADVALRVAKHRGKGRIEQYDPAYDRLLRRRITLEHELRGAIARDELRLAFQPVVALPSVRPIGVEALLRWTHPDLGTIAPGEFIPVAEEAGLIGQLGLWVLHQACHQLAQWLNDGHDVWISVNASVRDLHSPTYVDLVADVLRTHRVPPQRLVIEVTEQEVAVDLDELALRLTELRATGVRVALDDFGAGYSSLGQLHRLPVDILKIDRNLLVESAPEGRGSGTPFIDVVVRLGHRLGLTVVAEGVEEVHQRRLLEEMDCPLAQGNLFGRPMPAEHVEAMLAASAPPVRALPASPASSPSALLSLQPVPDRVPQLPDRVPQPAHKVGHVDSAHEMRNA